MGEFIDGSENRTAVGQQDAADEAWVRRQLKRFGGENPLLVEAAVRSAVAGKRLDPIRAEKLVAALMEQKRQRDAEAERRMARLKEYVLKETLQGTNLELGFHPSLGGTTD